MQAYPGRDPVFDALRGKISIRQLRVMLENLPTDNAIVRELHGRWGDDQRIAHDISSSLRILITQHDNLYRPRGTAALEPKFLPTPETMAQELAAPVDTNKVQAERDFLQMVLSRPNPH